MIEEITAHFPNFAELLVGITVEGLELARVDEGVIVVVHVVFFVYLHHLRLRSDERVYAMKVVGVGVVFEDVCFNENLMMRQRVYPRWCKDSRTVGFLHWEWVVGLSFDFVHCQVMEHLLL